MACVGLIDLDRSSSATFFIESIFRLIEMVSVMSGRASCFKRFTLAAWSSVVSGVKLGFLTEPMSLLMLSML